MRAAIRTIMSLAVVDLAAWLPGDADFAIGVRIIAGPEGGEGEESFDLTVCTGGWLAQRAADSGFFDARHHLVVPEFNWSAISGYLTRRVAECQGETWRQVGEQLARLGYWEFEDYQP